MDLIVVDRSFLQGIDRRRCVIGIRIDQRWTSCRDQPTRNSRRWSGSGDIVGVEKLSGDEFRRLGCYVVGVRGWLRQEIARWMDRSRFGRWGRANTSDMQLDRGVFVGRIDRTHTGQGQAVRCENIIGGHLNLLIVCFAFDDFRFQSLLLIVLVRSRTGECRWIDDQRHGYGIILIIIQIIGVIISESRQRRRRRLNRQDWSSVAQEPRDKTFACSPSETGWLISAMDSSVSEIGGIVSEKFLGISFSLDHLSIERKNTLISKAKRRRKKKRTFSLLLLYRYKHTIRGILYNDQLTNGSHDEHTGDSTRVPVQFFSPKVTVKRSERSISRDFDWENDQCRRRRCQQ